MRINRAFLYPVIAVLLGVALSSCFEEQFTESADAKLEFSLDTLRFDTVFTELGSVTRFFKVYNNNDLPVRIGTVSLDESSFFRFNVDGYEGPVARDVEILDGDSIWVFVEVTVDPDQDITSSPFVIEEFITFELNGNMQQVMLEAWGQNANYIPDRFGSNGIAILTCGMGTETWDDPKPYVIYGTLLVDSCTLVWPAGTEVYVHGGLANNALGSYNDGVIFTLSEGRIRSEGTLENPVIVSDDRIEEEYTGVWGGLRFGPVSGPHVFSHTRVSNAVTAVVVDSASSFFAENSVFEGSNGTGLFARNARVSAVNSLFADNAGVGVALTFGGDYDLDYCTIASYGNDGEALVINDFFCADPNCSTGALVTSVNARLRNCILVGSSRDELTLFNAGAELPELRFDVSMQNCIVQVDNLLDEDRYPDFFETICTDCITYTFGDTLFADIEMSDYHLDTLSIAIDKGLTLAGVTRDLEESPRDPTTPDIGCYEFQK